MMGEYTDTQLDELQRLGDDLDKLSQLIEILPIPVELYTPNGSLHAVNSEACTLWGQGDRTAIGTYNILTDNAEKHTLLSQAFGLPFLTSTPAQLPAKKFVINGNEKWLRTKVTPICQDDGPLNGVLLVREDVTRLIQEGDKYKQFIEEAGEAIMVVQDDRLKFFNRKALEVTGYSQEEYQNKPFYRFIHPDDREMVRKRYEQRLHGQHVPEAYQFRVLDAKGQVKWLQISANIISWEGKPATLAFLPDITHLKQAEQAWRESEIRFQMIAETTNDLILLSNEDGQTVFANSAMEKQLGYLYDRLRNMPFLDLIHPDNKSDIQALWQQVLAAESVPPQEVALLRADGSTLEAEVSCFTIYGESSRPYFGAIMRDISRRKHAEAELASYRDHLEKLVGERTSELTSANNRLQQTIIDQEVAEEELSQEKNKLEAVVAGIGDGLSVHDSDFVIQYQNPTLNELFGDSQGKFCYQVYFDRNAPCDNCGMINCLKDGNIHRCELTAPGPGGNGNESRYLEITVSPVRDSKGTIIAAVEIFRDTTEHKKLVDQLLQAQKMEAIGTLAGGIAHDFNNILTGILGYAELSRYDVATESDLYGNLTEIINASNRAGDLVRQILTFSRQTEFKQQPLAIQPIVKEAIKLIRGTIPATINIQQEINCECGSILADVTQIHQVIMNLCANAYHAMRHQKGTLFIGLDQVAFQEDMPETPLHLPPGNYIRLTVSDTGHGMDDATLERIFEPYFTTKGHGEGTGLGLATVHGIVENHGGAITVKSTPDEGTKFEIYFPAVDESIDYAFTDDEINKSPVNAHILYVDDEEMLVRLGSSILRKLGFTVTSTSSSHHALEIFQAGPDKFDLLLTDQIMPGMTGQELAQQCLAIRSELPVVLTTGLSEAVSQCEGITEVMMKPITINKMANTISQVLADKK